MQTQRKHVLSLQIVTYIIRLCKDSANQLKRKIIRLLNILYDYENKRIGTTLRI